MTGKRAVVIGAGLGGLSASALLAHAGWKVTCFDLQEYAGGKANTNDLGDYRFDTGPSLLTMTGVFDDYFSALGKRREDYVGFLPLDTICTYYLSDGTRFTAHAEPAAMARGLEALSAGSGAAFEEYLSYARAIYDVGADLFLKHSLHERSTYFSRETVRSIARFGRIDPFRTMDRANRRFFRDPRIVQLFDRYATYNGSSPYRVPATLNIIQYVEYGLGGYAVDGGIVAIPRALEKAAREEGVEFRLGTKVTGIVTGADRSVRGVKFLDGDGEGEAEADVVVSNADVDSTYADLLGDPDAPYAKRYRRLEPSSSALVFYWGIRGIFPELGVNNIFFSRDYPAEFRSIFEELRCPDDPTVYVNITSKTTPGDAPPGCENWFVLVNAPRNEGQDWGREIERIKERVLVTLEGRLGRRVEDLIEAEDVMTPRDIEARTGSRRGSLYGISSNSKLSAFLRHPNRSKRYPGLYFCGGSAHPGGGMPLALLSGRIAAGLIGRYHG